MSMSLRSHSANALVSINNIVSRPRAIKSAQTDMAHSNPPIDQLLLTRSKNALAGEMNEVIDEHADGVNQIAIEVRKETDYLLLLGISDPCAAEASMFAQHALHLANVGRGVDLEGKTLKLTIDQRIEIVSTAMSSAITAERLLKESLRKCGGQLEQKQIALSQLQQKYTQQHLSI